MPLPGVYGCEDRGTSRARSRSPTSSGERGDGSRCIDCDRAIGILALDAESVDTYEGRLTGDVRRSSSREETLRSEIIE